MAFFMGGDPNLLTNPLTSPGMVLQVGHTSGASKNLWSCHPLTDSAEFGRRRFERPPEGLFFL